MFKKYENCTYTRTALKFGVVLSFSLLYSLHIQAAEVATWADLNTTEDILLTADIQAEGTPQTITINSDINSQTIDGGNHSLTGAAGYKIQISNSNEESGVTIQNFGKVVDGTEESNTYSYTDTNGNTIYKTIDRAITGFDGGAFVFSAYPRKISVKDTVFYNNTGKVLDIWLKETTDTASITDTVFYGNTIDGDEIAVLTISKGTVDIDNLVFASNTIGTWCQGLDFFAGTNVNISNSIFQNNTTGAYGTLQLSGGLVNIDNSQFINNYTRYYDGGAITVTSTMQNITNSIFRDNRAGQDGGAIWYAQLVSSPYIVNTTFEENQANRLGGAMYIGGTDVSTGTVYILGSDFKNNESSYGGGIYTYNSTNVFIVDTDFKGNVADEGGAIYAANEDINIFANTKDVTFADNVANNTGDTYNGGAAVYYEYSDDTLDVAMNINAASGRKVIFDNSIAAYGENATININKSGLSYEDIDGNSVDIGTTGEIQFNDKVGDESGNIFDIYLYGGKLSIGQNATLNTNFDNPDGLINDNNFTVAGDSILNTANGIIGTFAPETFNINAALKYEFDIDLANTKSDKLVGATINNGGSLNLSVLNIISDSDVENLKITYSDTNIGGALEDDYTITTSSATYDVTAGNDDTGSYLLFTKTGEAGGLANAIKNASDVYSITSGSDEVVTAWQGNNLLADLVINGNGQAITTENNLDGINIDSSRTLTMNGVSDMTGFNYAFSNDGTVKLTNTTISDNIINNGTLEINENVSLGEVSGTGIININADHELNTAMTADTVNVKNAELSGVNNLSSGVNLNVLGGVVALDNQGANVKSASFDANSTLSLAINSATDYGNLTAENITVAEGAKLQATLAQGLVSAGETLSLQLLSANNTDFNNFSDSFDNNMYHFEKDGKDGKYNVYLAKTAEEVVEDAGGQHWVAEAAKAYVDGDTFEGGSVAADVANKLAGLAQNDAKALITEIKALAPTEAAIVQDQAIANTDILFKTVEGHLRGERSALGVSSGDILSDINIWANPYVRKTKISSSGKVAGHDSKNIGVIAGIEKKIDSAFKLGAGLQYDETDIDALRRKIDVSTKLGFVYGEYKPSNWFVNAVVAYGLSDYDEHKFALGSRYAANYDVRTTSMAITAGYQIDNLIPEFALRYYNIKRDAYTDTASQRVKASSTDYLRATSGVRYSKEYGMFTPDVYVGLGYDIVSPENNTFVKLSNGAGYIVDGKRLSRLEYEFSAGVNAHLNDNTTLGIGYMGAYRNDYQDHTLMLRMQYEF